MDRDGYSTALFTLFGNSLNKRIDHINKRLEDMRELWRSELRRVEEVLDARLKHIEEERC
jgi:hypothetical protein